MIWQKILWGMIVAQYESIIHSGVFFFIVFCAPFFGLYFFFLWILRERSPQ